LLPSLTLSELARQRSLREARAAAALKHDHIVTIYQVGEDHGVPFLTMELLKGESLDHYLSHVGQLAVAEVLHLGRQIALGLRAAHEKGLIHRDIKPSNIWLEGEPGESAGSPTSRGGLARSAVRVKLLDFGLVLSAEKDPAEPLTREGVILGTPAYMSPEQARGERVDPRSDLFSLGCVLYRLCTGRLPFRGATSSVQGPSP
jgi:serine/threonine protein kinase